MKNERESGLRMGSRRAARVVPSALALLMLAARTQTVAAADSAPVAVTVAAPASAPRELTLDQALSRARQGNRTLTAERVHLQQAQINVDRAWTVLFPTLTAQGKFTRNDRAFLFPVAAVPATATTPGVPAHVLTFQPLNQLDGTVSFSAPLAVPAAYPALRAVNLSERASEENYASALDNVLFTVAQTFHAAAVADEVLIARRSNIEVARATLADAKTRFGAGAVTKVDVDRAEVSVLRAEQAERDAQLGRDETYRTLGTLIQDPGPFRVRPATTVAETPAPYSSTSSSPSERENLLATALRLRPEFRALEASAESSRAEQSSHAWQWAPSLSAFGNTRIFNYQNFAGVGHSWAIGALLDWQLYDGGVRDTQRRLAAAVAAETASRTDVLRDTIRDDLENGRREIETKTQARITAERSVDLARETLELVRVQYEAGAATQVDLLQAQDSLVAAQDALARAHYDIAIADLTFRRAAGTLSGQ